MSEAKRPGIRPMTAADVSVLQALLAADKTFREDEVDVAIELIQEAASGSEDYEVLVAEQDKVLGYICFGPTPMTAGTFDLYWIVTHPEARGRGIASALIVAMEQTIKGRGATAVRVETSQTESYGGARRLYAKLEYPEASLLEDFYSPGDGLITYYKRL